MRDIIYLLNAYFRLKIRAIFMIVISFSILLIVFSLYSLPLEALYYSVLLITSFLIVLNIYDFISYYNRYKVLRGLIKNMDYSSCKFPRTNDLIEGKYQELIELLSKERLNILNANYDTFSKMNDYYSTWAHQIKTPIAAMNLILQTGSSNENSELLEQLFKIDQYVEMVLQYLRVEDISADLIIKSYSLDDIVKQAVRKYSKMFIRKRIKLNYDELNCRVLTDEKWLVFVIEQILSNGLKYTNSGEISIYMDKVSPQTLVIEDTGIGIQEEDLPRIFEKGYTGYNGRSDKKSTGIGLYLSKRILNKLSHTITIESKVDKGTKVKIGLDTIDINIKD